MNSDELERDNLTLFVNFANVVREMKISVFASNPISSIFGIFPRGNKIVLYQGKIVQSSLTFENYEIQNNDHIVIQFEVQLEPERFWPKSKRRFDIADECLMNQDISRLADFALCKIENNQKYYRHFIKNYFFLQNESIENNYHTCLI